MERLHFLLIPLCGSFPPGLLSKQHILLSCALVPAYIHSWIHTYTHSLRQKVLLWWFQLRIVHVFYLLPFCCIPDSRCVPSYDLYPCACVTFPSAALRCICQVRHAHISFARRRTSFRIRSRCHPHNVPSCYINICVIFRHERHPRL